MSETELIGYEVDEGGVAMIRLQRPDSRNALNTQMLVEMLEHLAVARGDDAVRVLVITSSDQMGLSAGADVKEQLDEEGKVHRMQLFADLYDGIVGFPKPTIAVCHGDVVGGGAEIAAACDMRVGGSNLRMRFPGAALGVPVGPARLVTLCGLATAKYLLLSSRTIAADEALRIGLVNRVLPRRSWLVSSPRKQKITTTYRMPVADCVERMRAACQAIHTIYKIKRIDNNNNGKI